MLPERWRELPIGKNHKTFGSLLSYVFTNYDGVARDALRLILRWLNDESTEIYYSALQSNENRRMWLMVAEMLHLEHEVLEFTEYRIYCADHRVTCRSLKYGGSVESDLASHWDCKLENQKKTIRHICILAPEAKIDNLYQYLRDNDVKQVAPFKFN